MSATPPLLGPSAMAVRVFLPVAFGLFLSYLFRNVNAVIADDIARDVGADAADLGVLTSALFLSFACFQIPLGILLDRFGPRRVEGALLVVAALGGLAFSLAQSVAQMAFARAIIGVGVSACLMAAFKAATLWWPQPRLPLVNGLIMASGALGALVATTPMAALVAASDWRIAMRVVAGASLVGAFFILFAMPERAGGKAGPSTVAEQWRSVAHIFSSASFWRDVPATMMVQAIFLAYIGLWAARWLQAVDGLSPGATATILQTMPLALIIGFLATGWAAERLGRRGIAPLRIANTCVVLFVLDLASLVTGAIDAPALQWGGLAFLATAMMIVYPVTAGRFPPAQAGRVLTAINLIGFIGAFLVQAGVGLVIDRFENPGDGHRAALAMLMVLTIGALAWSWRARPPRELGA